MSSEAAVKVPRTMATSWLMPKAGDRSWGGSDFYALWCQRTAGNVGARLTDEKCSAGLLEVTAVAGSSHPPLLPIARIGLIQHAHEGLELQRADVAHVSGEVVDLT